MATIKIDADDVNADWLKDTGLSRNPMTEKRGQPLRVSKENFSQIDHLKRLDLKEELTEAWLQELLDQAPATLPVSEIDDRIELPIYSLGREINTASGPIDNLFLSRSGHVVLVETKLWRNPEARRTVVAQILDYAGHLRKWSYEDIQKLWAKRHPEQTEPDAWQGIAPDVDEHEWVDAVCRNLSDGRMALLIAGDGIRSETRQLAETVAGHPDFPFRLALIELRIYDLGEDVLVIPQTLVQTDEIERAIVRVTVSDGHRPIVKVEVPDEVIASGKKRGTLSKESFLEELSHKDAEGQIAAEVAETLLKASDRSGLTVVWGAGGFMIKTPDPNRPGVLFSLANVTRQPPVVYAYYPWLRDQIARIYGKEAGERLATAQADLFNQLGGRPVKQGIHLSLLKLRG